MVSKVVLLARAEPTAGFPLALLPVANRPLIRHELDSLAQTGVTEVLVVADTAVARDVRRLIGDGSDWPFHVEMLQREATEGTRGTLAAVEDFVDGHAFGLHLGDSLWHEWPLPALAATEIGALDAVMAVRMDDDMLQGAAAGPVGLYVMGAAVLDAARGVDPCSSYELELSVALARMAGLGGKIESHPVAEWWRCEQRPGVLLEANRFALEGMWREISEARVHPTARLESTIVRGPAVIGAGATLTDAYVGPYTSIGEAVRVEGAEIENSIILPGATISHLGSRLEASVVGPRARVCRDFRLPKALRLTVGEGAEVSLA
jgi:glucose-1-phosphate thymidylyltransferase